jgi:[ribosomal protein S5]-alanine N-acetyltransferase
MPGVPPSPRLCLCGEGGIPCTFNLLIAFCSTPNPNPNTAMTPQLQSARLILQPLQLSDAGQIQRLFPYWDVVQFLNSRVPWPFPEDGVLAYFREAALPAIERGEEWHWTLRLKTNPAQIVGAIGLHTRPNHNRGFWLAPAHQGQGLMTEAVAAVNDYWFNELNFPILRTTKAIANTTSRRISEKMGMRVVATTESDYVSGRLPSETWEITAEEWQSWREQNRRLAGQ